MAPETNKELDIVLPCYNPIKGWATDVLQSMQRLQQHIPATKLNLYLVNDGSLHGVTDTDISLLKSGIPDFTYLHYSQNCGKGHALRFGISHTKNELCIYTDIDFPYTEQSFLEIYQALQTGNHDIVVGVRSESYYDNVPKARVRISKVLRFVTRKLLSLPVNDTQAGLKGFNSKGKAVFLQTGIDRYLFDLEFLFLAAKDSSLRIKAVSVVLKPGIVFSSMNAKILMNEGSSFMKIFLSNPVSRFQKKLSGSKAD